MKPEGMSEELVTEMRVVADRIEMQAIGASHAATVLRKMADEVQGLASKLATATEAIEETHYFLKYLIAGKSQYYYGDHLMANGMSHATDLDKRIKEARAALKSIEGGDEWDGTFRDGCDETKDHR